MTTRGDNRWNENDRQLIAQHSLRWPVIELNYPLICSNIVRMPFILPLALFPFLLGHGGGGGGAEYSKHAYSVWAEEHAEYRCDAYRQGMNWDEAFAYAMDSSGQGWRAVFVSYPEKIKAYNAAIKRDCQTLHVETWNNKVNN